MIYSIVRALIRFLLWIFADIEVEGREYVPVQGPVLLVSNHINIMDPIVPIGVLRRRVSFMVKEEAFRMPLMGRLLWALKLVPVARGKIASRRALQRAEEFLLSGGAFCIYPEGTRSRQPGMGPGHDGAALLALRTGATIVPVAITGSQRVLPEGCRFPHRDHISLSFGEPFRVEAVQGRIDRAAMEHLTECIMRRIATLLPREYRGVYADGGERVLVEVEQ